MQFDLLHMWSEMGFLNRLITVSLIVMGLACTTVFVERLYVIGRAVRRAARSAAEWHPQLTGGAWGEVLEAAREGRKGNPLAGLVAATLGAYMADVPDGQLTPLERARREADRHLEAASAAVRRGMPILASTGSVAPFVGLLGTVVGIIVAFRAISVTGSGGLSSVAGGISEALVETALGLCVAIPVTLMFNALTTRMDRFELTLGEAADRLLELLEDRGDGNLGRQRAA